ncbi:MAG: protein kinase [Myxococcales bacterium]
MLTTASRYELLDRIAIGGMAELFRARIVGEQGFSKVVAIKRILPQYAGDEHFVRMLIDEARTASYLSHPNIAEVHELRRDGQGGLFIALEYVSGPSLAGLLGKLAAVGRHLPEACALDIAIHLLEALDHAHVMTDPAGRSLGVVHRDVSPDNVLVTRDGTVKLTDFGVAKARGRLTQTQQGTIKGKLAYMSPEQVRGLEIDGRSDQFAAGLVLWEALTGRTHYDATNDFELMKQVAEGTVRPLHEAGIAVDPAVQEALDRAMAPTPEERFPRCADFAKVLAIHHRKTWPGYSKQELGAVVDQFYKERFDLLAERLRRFEEGKEKPVGMISLATDPAGTLAPADDGSGTDTSRQAAAPRAAPRKLTKDPGSNTSAKMPRRPSRASEPAPKRPKAPVAAAPVEEDAPPPKAPAAEAPKKDSKEKDAKKAERKAQDAEVNKALAAAKTDDKGAKKGGAMSGVLAFFVFLLAVGGGVGGMAWLRGTGFSLDDEEATPLPMPATPLARPDDPKDTKEPKPGKGTGTGKSREVKVGDATKTADGAATGATGGSGAEAAPAAPTGPVKTGTLDVECIPAEGCMIELDGARGVPAPLTRVVPAGIHKVRLINQMIGARREVTVEVVPDKTTTKAVNLVTGR